MEDDKPKTFTELIYDDFDALNKLEQEGKVEQNHKDWKSRLKKAEEWKRNVVFDGKGLDTSFHWKRSDVNDSMNEMKPAVNTPHRYGKMKPGERLEKWKAEEAAKRALEAEKVKTSEKSTGVQTPRTARNSQVFNSQSTPKNYSSKAENIVKTAAAAAKKKEDTDIYEPLNGANGATRGGRRTRKRRRKRIKRRRKRTKRRRKRTKKSGRKSRRRTRKRV